MTKDEPYISLRHFFMDLLYTVFISTVIAAFLTVTGINSPFIVNFIMSQSFGISICSAVIFFFWIFKPQRASFSAFVTLVGVICGIVIALQIGPFVLEQFFSIPVRPFNEKTLIQTVFYGLLFGITVSYFFISRDKLKLTLEEIQQERLKRLASEKEAVETRLRMLQAQVEPHFLFNTLSNVLSLIDTNPAQGKAMLMDLIRYLRTSLSRTRDSITLDQESEILRAYLNIQKIRMGERLRFRIDIPDALRAQPFPPLLLQPLVENAVKHGLEPKIEGGEITIAAADGGGIARIEVRDTGQGFSSISGSGVGIENVRERLRLLYGDRGRLLLEENQPSGVRAVIEVPKE